MRLAEYFELYGMLSVERLKLEILAREAREVMPVHRIGALLLRKQGKAWIVHEKHDSVVWFHYRTDDLGRAIRFALLGTIEQLASGERALAGKDFIQALSDMPSYPTAVKSLMGKYTLQIDREVATRRRFA